MVTSTKWVSPVLPSCTGSAIERISCRITRSPTGARPSAVPMARSSSGQTFFTAAGFTRRRRPDAPVLVPEELVEQGLESRFQVRPTGGRGVSVWSSERNWSSGAMGSHGVARVAGNAVGHLQVLPNPLLQLVTLVAQQRACAGPRSTSAGWAASSLKRSPVSMWSNTARRPRSRCALALKTTASTSVCGVVAAIVCQTGQVVCRVNGSSNGSR